MKTTMTAQAPFTAEDAARIKQWRDFYPHPEMGLIEALRWVQEKYCVIKPESAAAVAEIFGLPFSRVWSVATFFPSFSTKPVGRHRIGLCHGLSCHLAGAKKMAACVEKNVGAPEHQVTADGRLSWESMECLGACEMAPAFQVNDRLQGKASEESISRVVSELK